MVGLAGSALAANKFWGGPAGNAASPVSGTWDTASANWSTTSAGASGTTFAASDTATFGGIDGITIKCSTLAAGTITNNNSYTFTNDTPVTVSMATGTPLVIAPGKTVTIGNNVIFGFNTGSGGTINANNVAFGGTLIIDNGGILQQTSNQSMQFDGNGTLIRVLTGGLFQHTGSGSNFRLAASAGNSATLNIEGGTAKITGTAGCLISASATSTATLNLLSGLLNVTNNPVTLGGNSASTCIATNNLNGGVELVRQIKTTASTTLSIFNFNGGTLKAGSSALASTFMTGLTTANVRNNNSTIDNGGYAITIGQPLLHSTIGGDNATDGGLTILGSGSLTLTGANTYNGPTAVNAGKLITTSASVGAGAYSVADGATLEVQVAAAGQSLTNSSLTLGTSGNVTNNFTLGANASTTVPAVVVNGALNLNGAVNVTVTGSGLTGPNTYSLMSYGSISGSGSFVAGTLPAVAGYIGTLTNDTTAKQLKLIYAQAPQPVKWAVADGNWDTTTLNWSTLAGAGPTNFVDGALTVWDDSATGSSPITVTLSGDRSPTSISNNAAKTYILAGGSAVIGSATITKNGSGTLVIDNSGANNLSAVAINAGTLQLGNNDANGNLGSATVTNNGTLALTRADNFTLNNVLSGPGTVVQNGGGNATLGAANTHAGLTVINSGLLTLGNAAAVQSSTVSNNVANGLGFASGITAATLGGLAGAADFSGLNVDSSIVALTVGGNHQSTTFGGSITSGGNFLKAGTGVTTLTGSSIFGNVQTTGAGTLIFSNGSSTLSSLQLVADNSSVRIAGGYITVTTDSRINGSNCTYLVSGGVLNLPKMTVGALSGSSNSVMTVSGSAQVNQNAGGGTAPINQLLVGGNNGGSGTLLLKDNASWNNISTLANAVIIGNVGNGQGVLTLQDNATFYNAQVMRVADLAGNGGTVNLNGGNILVNGFSKGAGTGIINVNGGQVTALTANNNFFNGFTNTGGSNAVNLVSGRLILENNGNAITVSNVLSGAGGLTSQGGGILTLPLANTYTGATVVNGGILKLTGAGSINSSSSISNNPSATLDVSTSATQLSIAGAFVLNDATLIMNLASTNITVGTFGTAGSVNTINLTALPAVSSVPAKIRVIKYTSAAAGLVDGGNNLTTLGVILPAAANPAGYLTNNTAANSIDLVITNMLIAPTIASQPADDSAYAGGKAHFSVALVTTNVVGLHYQWRKAGTPLTDGANVSGATSDTVHLSNITGVDAVNYDVVVTNNSGSVTSALAALTFLTPTNYEASAVAAGPVALYMFQETGDPATNATAFDYAGDLDGFYAVAAQNGYNGITGPTSADGFPGFDVSTKAARFMGFTTNSHVALPPLNLNTNTVTFAAWINPGLPPANSALVFCRGGGTVAGFNFTGSFDGVGNRTLGYTWNNEGGTYGWNSQIAPPPGIWSYVALVISPTNATVYIFNVNGLLSASQNFTHVNQSFSADTRIGDDAFSGGNRQFDGSIYGAAVYAKSLSQPQLEALYSAASGVSNFAPVVVSSPTSVTRYEHQTATFTAGISGSQPLAYQWRYFDGVSTYTDIINGGRISGAKSPSLSISNLFLADAGNLVLVATNNFGAVTSSVAMLTVNPVLGPATNITTSVAQPSTDDWDTATAWSLPGSATDLAGQYYGSTFTILVGGGTRTPSFGNPGSPTAATFPGDELRVEGAGTFDTGFTASGGIRIKGGNPATVNFKKLVMAGGQISSILNSGWTAILTGELNVISNTVIWASDDTSPRSINVQSKLTGNGNIIWRGYINFPTFQTATPASLNIASANNTYTGTWDVLFGSLVGSAPNALGTNTITVEAQGALQTTYDIYNTNSTLVLNGRMYLTQNDTFKNVVINGTNLNGGTYSYATLAATYPANFPAAWTPLNGALSATTPGGSITVLASTIAAYPTNITASVNGNSLSLTWPATHLGWIAQSNSVSLANTNFWFDIAGSQSATNLNVIINPATPNVFYRLRHP